MTQSSFKKPTAAQVLTRSTVLFFATGLGNEIVRKALPAHHQSNNDNEKLAKQSRQARKAETLFTKQREKDQVPTHNKSISHPHETNKPYTPSGRMGRR